VHGTPCFGSITRVSAPARDFSDLRENSKFNTGPSYIHFPWSRSNSWLAVVSQMREPHPRTAIFFFLVEAFFLIRHLSTLYQALWLQGSHCCSCQFGFNGVRMCLDILALFRNSSGIGSLSGRLFDERLEPFLPIHRETVKIIGAQKRRINLMRREKGVELLAINRRRCVIAPFPIWRYTRMAQQHR